MSRIISEREFKAEEERSLALISSLGMKYKLYEHRRVATVEDCEGIGADIGAGHFKNLFLTNRAGTKFYILLLPAEKRFVSSEVSRALGVSRLCFANEDMLMEKLGLIPGCVTPLGIMCDNARDVAVIIDREILKLDMACLHPRTPYASIAMHMDDIIKLIEHFGNTVLYI